MTLNFQINLLTLVAVTRTRQSSNPSLRNTMLSWGAMDQERVTFLRQFGLFLAMHTLRWAEKNEGRCCMFVIQAYV